MSGLREDSALSAVGMTPADAVCVADALDLAARRAGLDCARDDADFAVEGDLTVADLINAVMKGMTEEDTP